MRVDNHALRRIGFDNKKAIAVRPLYVFTCPKCDSKQGSLEARRTVQCQDCGAEYNTAGNWRRNLALWGGLLMLLLLPAFLVLFVVVVS